jgi:hypothetical protein
VKPAPGAGDGGVQLGGTVIVTVPSRSAWTADAMYVNVSVVVAEAGTDVRETVIVPEPSAAGGAAANQPAAGIITKIPITRPSERLAGRTAATG